MGFIVKKGSGRVNGFLVNARKNGTGGGGVVSFRRSGCRVVIIVGGVVIPSAPYTIKEQRASAAGS